MKYFVKAALYLTALSAVANGNSLRGWSRRAQAGVESEVDAAEAVQNTVTAFVNTIKGNQEDTDESKTEIGETAAKFVDGAKENAAEEIAGAKETAAEAVAAAEESAGKVKEAADATAENVLNAVNTAKENAAEEIDGALETVTEVATTAEETAEKVKEAADATAENVLNAVNTAKETAGDAIVAATTAAEDTAESLQEAVDGAKESAAETVATVTSTAEETVDKAKEVVSTIPGGAEAASKLEENLQGLKPDPDTQECTLSCQSECDGAKPLQKVQCIAICFRTCMEPPTTTTTRDSP